MDYPSSAPTPPVSLQGVRSNELADRCSMRDCPSYEDMAACEDFTADERAYFAASVQFTADKAAYHEWIAEQDES